MSIIKKAVIPAAGLGSRFLPISRFIPKELLPIANYPVIHEVVIEALESGIREIIIITSPRKPMIKTYLGHAFSSSRYKNRLHISYVDQDQPKGLGHAILQAQNLIPNEAFAVLLPDDIIRSNPPALQQMINVFKEHKKSIIALEKIDGINLEQYGVIKPEALGKALYKILDVIEKPKLEEAPSNLGIVGRYIFTAGIFPKLESLKKGALGELQLTDAINELNRDEGVFGFQFQGDHYDCGSPIGLLAASIAAGLSDSKTFDVVNNLLNRPRKW